MQLLKHLIKKYFWKIVFKNKIYGAAVAQNKAFVSQLNESPSFSKNKLNIFTVDDEDGILLNIITKTRTTKKTFIDIGSNDCINSNCANLAFHHGWQGVFIDGNKSVLERGKYIYKKYFGEAVNRFSFFQAIVTVKNVNDLLQKNDVDLLSIDLDGNDYFIWDAIHSIRPKIVLVEVQAEKGNADFIPEQTTEFELYESDTPKGASPSSMVKLANKKGYELVATNKGCYNLFFVRKDCLYELKPISVEEAILYASEGITPHQPALE